MPKFLTFSQYAAFDHPLKVKAAAPFGYLRPLTLRLYNEKFERKKLHSFDVVLLNIVIEKA